MYLALSPLKYESVAIRATKVFHRRLCQCPILNPSSKRGFQISRKQPLWIPGTVKLYRQVDFMMELLLKGHDYITMKTGAAPVPL